MVICAAPAVPLTLTLEPYVTAVGGSPGLAVEAGAGAGVRAERGLACLGLMPGLAGKGGMKF